MKKAMTVYSSVGDVAAEFYAVRREGSKLVVDAKALGALRMDMVFTPAEAWNGLKLALSPPVVSFILLLPFFGLKRLFQHSKDESGKGKTRLEESGYSKDDSPW